MPSGDRDVATVDTNSRSLALIRLGCPRRTFEHRPGKIDHQVVAANSDRRALRLRPHLRSRR